MTPLSLVEPSAAPFDILSMLLADKRSPQTRRAYEGDVRDFFHTLEAEPTPANVSAFLSLPAPQLATALAFYKAALNGRGAAEATINRRLAAVRSLLKFANRLGRCVSDGRNLIEGTKAKAYRDTRGISLDAMKRLLELPAKLWPGEEVQDLRRRTRDEALLRLLCENGLRCDSVVRCDVGDFEPLERVLSVYLKGHGSQQKRVTLSPKLVDALRAHLRAWGHARELEAPLFSRLSRTTRLTHGGLRDLVTRYGVALGVPGLRPHKLRHSAITALLEKTKGDVRAVQKFSGHAKIETLLLYDDARRDQQGEMTNLLSKMLG